MFDERRDESADARAMTTPTRASGTDDVSYSGHLGAFTDRGGATSVASEASDSDSVARAIAQRVHVASKLAEYKRQEKLSRVRLAIEQAKHETDVLIEDGVDAYALEEKDVMSDGTSGSAVWLLSCAMAEGASAQEVQPLFEELVKFEVDLNSAGNRINHGKGLSSLALLCSLLEKKLLTPAERTMREKRAFERDVHQDETMKEVTLEGKLYEDRVKMIRKQVDDRNVAFTQTPRALVDFATALLAAGAEVNGKYRIQPETSDIADSRIAPYEGTPGTNGTALFFCALAIISGAGDEVLELAACLITQGASANSECERPGRNACCGDFLTPLTVCCAALESSIAYELDYQHRCRIAKLAGLMCLQCKDVKYNIESIFTYRLGAEDIRSRRIAPVECHTSLRGTALFILACAVAEGVGSPAMVLLDLLLEKVERYHLDVVGARPHHGRKLPLLAMIIDCIDAPYGFNEHGVLDTRSWWESAAVKANISDTGSVMGSQLSAQGPTQRRLHGVNEEDVVSLESFLPDINDAAFGGQGAVARREQLETERNRREHLKTNSEIAAEEEHERKARDIAAAIAEAERDKRRSEDVSNPPESVAVDEEDAVAVDEEGATMYTDEDGKSFVVGFTKEMLRTKSGVFDEAKRTPEELERARAQACTRRNARFESLIAMAKQVTISLIENTDKALLEVSEKLALGDENDVLVFNRATQARLDCIDVAKSLLKLGVNPNVRMPLGREFAHTCAETSATPLTMVCGYIARNMLEVYPLFDLLLEHDADINARGLGPYPISAPPLFTIALALYHGVEGADDAMLKLLPRNAVVDLNAIFPDGSKSTTLIQLIHALRAGKADRGKVLMLIKQLINMGADPNLCCVEVYNEGVPPAYLEAIKLTNHLLPPVSFAMLPEDTMIGSHAEENAQVASIVHRLRSPSMQLDLVEAGEQYDLSEDEMSVLEFGKIFNEVAHLNKIKDSGADDDSESVRSSMFGSVSNFNFGAPFPALPSRVGECQYPPLFWAIEAGAKEGHKESLELVLVLLDAGADVRRMIGKNFYSWVEGSLVAMAVTAAIRAAEPLPPPEEKLEHDKVNVAEVLLRLNQAAEPEAPLDSGKSDSMDNVVKHALEHAVLKRHPSINYKKGEDTPSFYEKIVQTRDEIVSEMREDDNIEKVRMRAVLERLGPDRPTDQHAYTVEEASDDGLNAEKRGPPALKMIQGVLRPEGSRFGPANLAARRDIPGLVRTVIVGHTSVEARAIELTKKANQEKERALRTRALNNTNTHHASDVSSTLSDRNIYESSSEDTDFSITEQLQQVNIKETEWDIREAEEQKERDIAKVVHGNIVPTRLKDVGIRAQALKTKGDESHVEANDSGVHVHSPKQLSESTFEAASNSKQPPAWESDEEFDEERDKPDETEMEKLYNEVSGFASRSENGDAQVLDGDWETIRPLTREELEIRHESRAKTTMAVAIALIERSATDNIDAFARNPLLKQYGVGLVPYEYTPLFAALYGAATAPSQSQIETGIALAKLCIKKGADVNKIGLHSVLAPRTEIEAVTARNQLKSHRIKRYRELRDRYVNDGDIAALNEKLDDDFTLEPPDSVSLRSYPLMWAVTAAIRAESRKLGCEEIVRYMLMEGADPTSISLQPIGERQGPDARLNTGNVLYLWGTAEDLFRASQDRYQSVISIRLCIARMLSECGARSSYRVNTNMPYVVNRTEAAAAGKWLVKGSEGFGVAAAPENDTSVIYQIEPFSQRVARAMYNDGDVHKRHVAVESNHERRINSLVVDQGASDAVGSWMWLKKDEVETETPPPVSDNQGLGFKSTADLDYVVPKYPGQIELFQRRKVAWPKLADVRRHSKGEAINIAQEEETKAETITKKALRRMQALAIRSAFNSEEPDVPQGIIDATLLPGKLLK